MLHDRSEFDFAVAVFHSEGSEVAAVATLRDKIEQCQDAARRQNIEQQHFGNATQELHLYYHRLFEERSEHILAENNQTLQELRETVEASAKCAIGIKNVQN